MADVCKKSIGLAAAVATLWSTTMAPAQAAQTIAERVKAGEPIRVGYANAAPWCFERGPNDAGGFATEITVETLKQMGYKVEMVVMPEWGGLVPGLMANRFDVVACGLYIMAERCNNIEFADPLAVIGDVFLLPKGNPKGIQTWQDIIKSEVLVGFVAGTNSLTIATEEGMDASKMVSFPSKVELVAAMKAGRIEVGAENLPEGGEILRTHPGEFELSDVNKQPQKTMNWPASGFRHQDADFAKLYNAAQKKYLGTPEMMSVVKDDFYTEQYLPKPDVTADWVCKNR